MAEVKLDYSNGRLVRVLMRDATEATVIDCRPGWRFVTINVNDKHVYFKAHLDTEAAESLTTELVKLFPQERTGFDPIAACQQIGDYLRKSLGGLTAAAQMALALLTENCRKQQAEDEKWMEVGV